MDQLTTDQAIALYDAKFWEPMSKRDRAVFQLNQQCLCMPFDVFHESVEHALGRPVFMHEFGLNYSGLLAELNGGAQPTLEDILALIPETKRVVIVAT